MAHYKLTSTVILTLGSGLEEKAEAQMDLGGYMTRQVEQEMPCKDDGDHISNVGRVGHVGFLRGDGGALLTVYIAARRGHGATDEESST